MSAVIWDSADPPEKWALRGPGQPAGATSRKLGQEISGLSLPQHALVRQLPPWSCGLVHVDLFSRRLHLTLRISPELRDFYARSMRPRSTLNSTSSSYRRKSHSV